MSELGRDLAYRPERDGLTSGTVVIGDKPQSLSFQTLRTANVKRSGIFTRNEQWSATDWACAAAGEMGEACNKIKKLRRGQDIPIKDVADEIADTIIYLDLLAAHLGIDMGQAVVSKFNEVTDRKVKYWDQGNEKVYL